MVICLNDYKDFLQKNNYECYTFNEFKNSIDYKDLQKLNPNNKNFNIMDMDNFIGKLLSNKDLYKKAIIFLAIGLQISNTPLPQCFAANTLGLEDSFKTILNLFFEIAQYSFLVLGIKDAVIKVLNGGTVKEAVQASLQYAFAFMFLKLYPTLYSAFSRINF